jgi:hypothetical protein
MGGEKFRLSFFMAPTYLGRSSHVQHGFPSLMNAESFHAKAEVPLGKLQPNPKGCLRD